MTILFGSTPQYTPLGGNIIKKLALVVAGATFSMSPCFGGTASENKNPLIEVIMFHHMCETGFVVVSARRATGVKVTKHEAFDATREYLNESNVKCSIKQAKWVPTLDHWEVPFDSCDKHLCAIHPIYPGTKP
jgi:hypothetical protein